jgi:hypothetical protein
MSCPLAGRRSLALVGEKDMATEAQLKRIHQDLEEAQAEIVAAPMIPDSVADKIRFGFTSLLAAVTALFTGLNDHEIRLTEQERQLKIAMNEIRELQGQVHGLKVSRGKAVAAKKRALAAIGDAQAILNGVSVH